MARNKEGKKMSLSRNLESFIDNAKESEDQREKTFLLRLPYDVWKKAKLKALEEEKTLQAFILEAVRGKISDF